MAIVIAPKPKIADTIPDSLRPAWSFVIQDYSEELSRCQKAIDQLFQGIGANVAFNSPANGDGQIMMEFFGASRLLAALTMAMAIGLCSAAANPILQTTPAGLLTGATGIDVNGTLYDAVFTAGSCVQVYGACEAANFPFHNLADASAASDALQRQVFLNTDQLLYDTIPALTRGCQAPLAAVQCNFATPYDIFFDGRHWVLGSTFENTDDHGAPGDRLFFMNNWAFWDQNLNDEGFVFVAWTKSTIPEPNVLAMFGAGLLALAGMRRKRKGA